MSHEFILDFDVSREAFRERCRELEEFRARRPNLDFSEQPPHRLHNSEPLNPPEPPEHAREWDAWAVTWWPFP